MKHTPHAVRGTAVLGIAALALTACGPDTSGDDAADEAEATDWSEVEPAESITFWTNHPGGSADIENELIAKTFVQSITMLFYLCSLAVGQASQIMIGHLVGAGKVDEAYRQGRRSHRTALIIMAITCTVGVLLRGPLIGLFTDNPEVVECVSLNPAYQPFKIECQYIRGWYRVLMVLALK